MTSTSETAVPLISAIVSTYNSERFIRGCIEDLQRQSMADRLEIIVVDSGSTQKEGDIVRELQARYSNLHYVRTEQRETVYAAWNRAVNMARGRYITNANTDDRHRSDAFQVMSGTLENDPSIDLVYADVLVTRVPNETFEETSTTERYRWFQWDRNLLLNFNFIGPQPMWRRSVHELYGNFDPSLVVSGDYEFWLRISQTSSFLYLEETLGLYLKHAESVEHANEKVKQRENREILTIYRKTADEGTIMGLRPFEQLQRFAHSAELNDSCHEINEQIKLVDEYISRHVATHSELMRTYLNHRKMIIEAPLLKLSSVEEYIQVASELILQSTSWFNNYRISGTHGSIEGLMRMELVEDSVAEARKCALRNDMEGAISTLLNKGIKANPTSPRPYVELAEILITAGRYADALQVLPEMPPHADHVLMAEIAAVCNAALGNDQAAYQASLQAPGRPRALVVLGTLAARKGDQDGAEMFFRRAVAADPSCGSGWISLGMLLWGHGKLDEAWQAVKCSVAADPLNGEAVKILLDMAERTDHLSDALEMVCESIKRYPDSCNLAKTYAELLAQCGKDADALDVCEMFLVKFGLDEELLSLALQLRWQIGVCDRLAEAGTQSVSLCMIVKNEGNNLPACLASLKPVVDEMIVVDTGSTDRTVDIAAAFGAKVSTFAWNGNFSDARNCAINRAGGGWILVMDADEVLAAQDYEAVRHAVSEDGNKKLAWSVLTRNYTTRVNAQGWISNDGTYPLEERADGWHPSWKVRLFHNHPDIRFYGEVHEMVENSLQLAGYTINKASFVVHHYGGLVESAEEAAEKGRRYFEFGMKKLEKNPNDAGALAELAVQAGEIGSFEEAVRLWDRLLGIVPDNVEALFNKGYALIKLQRYQEALAISEKALDLAPDHKEAAFNYGTSALYVGKPPNAAQKLEPLLQKYPEYPPLLAVLTLLYLISGQREKAVFTYSKLKTMNYAVTDYANARAEVLIRLGKEDLAGKLLDECAAIGMDVY